MLSKEVGKPLALVKANSSFIVLMVAFATETVTGMTQLRALVNRDEKEL
ncbi:hypothetical protein QEH58_11310 [Roseibacillus persicicus]|nr:hypothetical protein [Roseibacillus persicicus]